MRAALGTALSAILCLNVTAKPESSELADPVLFPAVGKAELLGPTLTDYDGDGQLDLVLGNYGGQLFLRPNGGSKSEPEFKRQEALKTAQGEIKLKHW